jgi:hypothetical protein
MPARRRLQQVRRLIANASTGADSFVGEISMPGFTFLNGSIGSPRHLSQMAAQAAAGQYTLIPQKYTLYTVFNKKPA